MRWPKPPWRIREGARAQVPPRTLSAGAHGLIVMPKGPLIDVPSVAPGAPPWRPRDADA